VTAEESAAFFERSPELVAPELLGWQLCHAGVTVVIVETEAYLGASDPASHAYRGQTPRNQSMFGPAAHCYVYRSYGMHWCFNVVTGWPGQAGAVLIRAGTVIGGHEVAAQRRGRHSDLANGPGRLGQALGLDRSLDGSSLLEGPMRLSPPLARLPLERIARGPRVGISQAVELPLRFWVRDCRDVSRGRPGPANKGRPGATDKERSGPASQGRRESGPRIGGESPEGSAG
jgi:DNA-3-methyladenine glycosylase